MTSLTKLLLELETARKKATQGEWEFNAALFTQALLWLPEWDGKMLIATYDVDKTVVNPKMSENAKFIAESANNILKLIEACRVLHTTMKQITMAYATNGEEMAHNIVSRKALARVEELCQEKESK